MRKVLSFVLVLSLVLGSFSMAFAATPAPAGLSDIADSANADAIQVAYDLGIVTGNPDGTFLPEKSVTRAEFAAMITRALAVPETALAGYTATTFKDTVGYGWAVPYLAFAQSKGIMLGDGNGNVMPGRTINVNEAMTMALRAVGYTSNSAELVGTWPANYVTLAQNASLYDDVANVVNVDKANAAQIIYNALTVQKVSVNSDGETKYLTLSGTTEAAVLLNTGLGCEAQPATTLDGDDYAIAAMNITPYIGAYGKAYVDDNGDGDIVAFTVESVALTGKADGDKFKVGDTKYSFAGTTTVGSVTAPSIINAAAADPAVNTIAAVNALADGDSVTLNVKLSGKTIDTVYSIVGWDANDSGVVDENDIDDIADGKIFGTDFITDSNEEVDLNQFALVGAASLDKIAKDNVVYVYKDGSDIRKVAVGTKIVKGEVTEKDGDSVYIDGTKYSKASLVTEAGNVSAAPGLEDDVELYLDYFGKYYFVDTISATADKYGVLTAYTFPGSSFSDDKLAIYTSDDSTIKPAFIDMDDVTWTTGNAISTAKGTFTAESGTMAGIIGYALDANGDIEAVDASALTAAGLVLKSNAVLDNMDVSEDVVVFTYETAITGGAVFEVSSIGSVEKNVPLDLIQYIVKDDEVVAMLVEAGDTDGTSDDVFAVVNGQTEVKDGTTTVNKLVGFIDGVAFTKNAINDSIGDDWADEVGLYSFTLNTEGKVSVSSFDAAATSVAGFTAQNITRGGISGNTFTMDDASKFPVASNAVVYKVTLDASGNVDEYVVGSLSDIDAGDKVWLYDTKSGDDHDNVANVVIYKAN